MYEFFTLVALIIFYSSIAIQLLFLLGFFSRLIWVKEKKGKVVQKRVSVVIAAHNELFNLKNLIPVLLQQDYPDFEIVLVLDRTTDGSKNYLASFSSDPRLRIVEISDPDPVFDPKKFALTTGVEKADGEIILLTDADCMPVSNEWIGTMVAAYEDETDIVLGYSPYYKRKGLLNLLIRFETFYTGIQYMSFSRAGLAYMGVGRNLSYRKNYFYRVKGFAGIEHLTGGDDDLLVQKGLLNAKAAIVVSQEAQTLSVPKRTWPEWQRQKKRHLSAGKYYDRYIRLILGFLTLSHLLFYVGFFTLLGQGNYVEAAFTGYFVRIFLIIVIFGLISEKFKERFTVISLPLLDFLYILNYLVVGIKAVVSRKATWK